jgi:hypothetical protein
MSTLSQVSRGAVLLTSMALVACYIDVYATGKFPWQHAAAETPVTVPPTEFVSDPAIQQVQYVQVPADQQQRIFMAGSKSDVAASAIVVQTPAANGPSNPAPVATPLFMSGSKSYGGATGLLPGALKIPASSQEDRKTQGNGQQVVLPATNEPGYFLGGGKSPLGMSGRIPETMPGQAPPSVTTTAPAVSPEKMQFMSGFKSPGPSVMSGTSLPTLPQSAPPGTLPATYPQSPSTNNQAFRPNVSPQQDKQPTNAPNSTPQFMGGSKTIMLPPRLPETTTPPISPEKMQFMSGSKSMGPAILPGATFSPPPPPLPPIQNGSKLQGYPTTSPANGNAPPTSLPTYDKPATTSPQFMSGSKSPFGRAPTPQQAAPAQQQQQQQQQQTAPSKLSPQNAPLSPAGSY